MMELCIRPDPTIQILYCRHQEQIRENKSDQDD